MQSVQLPNVGILLSKKEWNSEGVEVYLNTVGKSNMNRKSPQLIKWNSDKADSIHDFGVE